MVVHLLLVDDDAELCGLLGEFLRREGYTVDCEHEGNAGLEHAAGPGGDRDRLGQRGDEDTLVLGGATGVLLIVADLMRKVIEIPRPRSRSKVA